MYLAEAVNCANYIQNRTPHRALLDMTLEEAWTRNKLDIFHFRIFGSHAWAYISKSQCKALDKKSRPLIFINYYEDVHAYRLLDPTTHDVFFRKDV